MSSLGETRDLFINKVSHEFWILQPHCTWPTCLSRVQRAKNYELLWDTYIQDALKCVLNSEKENVGGMGDPGSMSGLYGFIKNV